MDTSERTQDHDINPDLIAAIERVAAGDEQGRPPGGVTAVEVGLATGWGVNKVHTKLREAVALGILTAEESQAPSVTGRLGRAVYYRRVEI